MRRPEEERREERKQKEGRDASLGFVMLCGFWCLAGKYSGDRDSRLEMVEVELPSCFKVEAESKQSTTSISWQVPVIALRSFQLRHSVSGLPPRFAKIRRDSAFFWNLEHPNIESQRITIQNCIFAARPANFPNSTKLCSNYTTSEWLPCFLAL